MRPLHRCIVIESRGGSLGFFFLANIFERVLGPLLIKISCNRIWQFWICNNLRLSLKQIYLIYFRAQLLQDFLMMSTTNTSDRVKTTASSNWVKPAQAATSWRKKPFWLSTTPFWCNGFSTSEYKNNLLTCYLKKINIGFDLTTIYYLIVQVDNSKVAKIYIKALDLRIRH